MKIFSVCHLLLFPVSFADALEGYYC